ncbi:thioredoxin domain-containing protein 3 [Sciurus carolinensis]|uniref:thioredoxin domain-containing protein 3 n=1 Tax=Sciurus carolinensis TaxID=30640 RepID=UPI001FB1FAC7|nr:thioredoxin domain-containing protein 3 [Sciurus carolinensis]
MASKKREVQLQTVVNSQSLWDEMLQNKGLTVIDVYQAWCGPCKAVQPLFRKLKNEINEDEILHFVVAEADNIVTLHSFRDKCEPVFLFSLNGKIIAKIEGANAPLINRKVTNLIDEEKKIVAGEMVRPQYDEILLKDLDSEEAGEGHDGNVEHYCITIIKPDAVISKKVLEIKEKILEEGFVIEAEDARMLTEEQVRDFYSGMADQPDFEEFVSFMTTNLSYVLVVSPGIEKTDSLGEIQALETEPDESPEDLSEAEVNDTSEVTEKNRDSLQECLERQQISQFCDIEDDATNVVKFLDIFFPDFKLMKSRNLERTLALLRPDLVQERKDEVLHIIEDEGFKILMQRQIQLSEEEAQTLCKEYENEDYYVKLIEYMTSGPSLALVLLRENGLQYWKNLLGPTNVNEASEFYPDSLCAQFAMGRLPVNQLYGSDSKEIAEREIQYFFPPQNTLAVIKPHVTHEQREEIMKIIKDAGFELTQLKEMVLNQEEANKIYYKIATRDFYKDVLALSSGGPSLVMVLTKWNAIGDWRRLMGPVDPEEARLLSPESIRAKYGINILKNAVHGASNTSEAAESISKMFRESVSEDSEEN